VPSACIELKLVDVPEMGYFHTDTTHEAGDGSGGIPCLGRGEIVYRGPTVFSGYLKMPEQTAEVLDSDGWLYSGDIGMMTLDRKLKIIDRKKNIFKLSQGEYIAPEKIENIHIQSKFVMQSFVYGDSLQSHLVAIIVPDPEVIHRWAKDTGKSNVPFSELCNSRELNDIIMNDLNNLGKHAKLSGFEFVKAIYLESEPFSPMNDTMTPTFKLKRQYLRDKYKGIIQDLYHKVSAQQSSSTFIRSKL